MQIATWNVNSARARLPRILDWLGEHSPDLVCLQEIKCQDEQFPRAQIEELGYNVETYGQKAYNGVALLSKEPMDDVRRGFPDDDDDAQARAIAATIGDIEVMNLYVVNGKEPGSDKFAYKMRWLDSLTRYLASDFNPRSSDLPRKIVLCGDFNITFDDRDIYDAEAWRGKIHCTDEEREALAGITELGFNDAFRHLHEEGGHFTWWDFRTRAWSGNRGLRIDHFLVSEPVLDLTTEVAIDLTERDQPKPSDHAPVLLTLT